MSAEILREAAALMRSRAEAAESGMAGPWESKVLTDGRAWVVGQFDSLSMHGYPSPAEHIASWHPAVALAVADWLDDTARVWEALDTNFFAIEDEPCLAVARAYLGRDA